ncbi:twisted gastrulation protein homolog 1-A [Eurytemora carolleeae]|uniref:twisted gastrulation protein homolog 1-A n=1 Tax=Eurytemora carolleeae TaxID=1294199 RepID=UPI000C75E262|nr:twisted gastrulation protein homolog 1-A [Eurytemora carolleeae]|eukprot:XP_023330723.1 twisted gastrulation protein homolog 1-A-like [Eurytemora affinis]
MHLVFGFIFSSFLIGQTYCCNEAVCASIVSKCMLLQSCKCELQPDCTCCKKCFECLDYLYSECCSCVDMCPKPNITIHELSKKSHVEDLVGNSPQLFQALTNEIDQLNRWSIVTFPIDLPTSSSFQPTSNKVVVKDAAKVLQQSTLPDDSHVTVNCTVAYIAQCVSWNKCKASCRSMGASSYRWFHDGCCECVGQDCINYGINQSRCTDCPILEDEDELTDEEMEELVNMPDYEDLSDLPTSTHPKKAKT